MSTPLSTFQTLSDQDLLREVTRLAAREREATACLVGSLAVLDRRRLYLTEGYGSMFAYGSNSTMSCPMQGWQRLGRQY